MGSVGDGPSPRPCARPARVAVVGTGLAGLVTAYLLHNDPGTQYEVTLFEKNTQVSLSAASVVLRDETGQLEQVDVPMRSFASSYYCNLRAMYDHLAVQYRVQRFIYAFSRAPFTQPPPATSTKGTSKQQQHVSGKGVGGDSYFVHASNWHQPYTPQHTNISWPHTIARFLFVVICYLWLTLCCSLIVPSDDETLDDYLRRVGMPQYFISHYLIPLMSSVATCSHAQLRQFPARDVVEYKRQLLSAHHLAVTEGILNVERKLVRGLDIRLGAEVQSVRYESSNRVRLQLSMMSQGEGYPQINDTQVFDHVVLATTPNVTARIFPKLGHLVSRIPSTDVTTTILRPASGSSALSIVDREGEADCQTSSSSTGFATQRISFQTSFGSNSTTTACQQLDNGVRVRTNNTFECHPNKEASALSVARFTRVLRTVESRALVNDMFGCHVDGRDHGLAAKKEEWRNGDQNVWLAGAWCWDGMVLLEGCVVSAMRIAKALNVDVPWESS